MSTKSIKLVSVNIEGNRHLQERVLPFLKKEQPEVVCLQEVFEVDLEFIKAELGMEGEFVVVAKISVENVHQPARGLWGLALLSKLPMSGAGYEYYVGSKKRIPGFYENEDPNSMNRAVLWAKVTKAGQDFWIATTHFTWSGDGSTTDLQRKTYQKMIRILDQFPDLILTGDFNAPRGKEIFDELSKRYKDNIPPDTKTTIDNDLHKAEEEINLVVDGLFSSSNYQVSEVKVVSGVSDHKAIVCRIARGL